MQVAVIGTRPECTFFTGMRRQIVDECQTDYITRQGTNCWRHRLAIKEERVSPSRGVKAAVKTNGVRASGGSVATLACPNTGITSGNMLPSTLTTLINFMSHLLVTLSSIRQLAIIG